MTDSVTPQVDHGTGRRAILGHNTSATLDRRASPSSRREIQRERVNRWGSIFLLCIAGQWIVCFIPMMVLDDTVGLPLDHDIPGAAVVRWLAFVPALAYLVATIVSFPLPRVPVSAHSSDHIGRMPVLAIGRLPLFVMGFVGYIGTLMQGTFPLPPGASELAAFPFYASYIVLAGWALVTLRLVLGLFRLLPRSWRVYTEEPAPPTDIVLPDQRFAPKDGGR